MGGDVRQVPFRSFPLRLWDNHHSFRSAHQHGYIRGFLLVVRTFRSRRNEYKMSHDDECVANLMMTDENFHARARVAKGNYIILLLHNVSYTQDPKVCPLRYDASKYRDQYP